MIRPVMMLFSREVRDVTAAEHDAATLGPVEAVDAIQHAGLSSAVGANDAEDLARCQHKLNSCDGLNPVETQMEVLHAEHRLGYHRGLITGRQ